MLSQLGTRPSLRQRGSLVSFMALCSLRTRLANTWRSQRRSFTSVSEESQKRLFSQDDWTAFQVERAERSTLSESFYLYGFTLFTMAFISSRHLFEIWFDKDSGQCMATSSSFTSSNGPTRPDDFGSSRCWSAPWPSQIVA